MSRPLNRPMFRMGGSPNTNSGIVSGFAQPRQQYAAGDAVKSFREKADEILGGYTYDVPEPESGLSAADWLRIAAAGGEMLGAEGRGSGLKGALAAAGPALSGLGKDLASSADARTAAKAKYDMGQAAFDQSRREAQLGIEAGALEVGAAQELQDSKKQEIDRQFEYYREAEGLYTDTLTEINNLDATSDSYAQDFEALQTQLNKHILEMYGSLQLAMPKPSALGDFTMASLMEEAQKQALGTLGLQEVPATSDVEGSKLYTVEYYKILKDLVERNQSILGGSSGLGVTKKADGGRIGYANGSTMTTNTGPYEPGSGPDPDPGSPPIMQAQSSTGSSPLSFEELRARLPREVSDDVIRLIATSEQALIDFAQIESQEDIARFNQRYNADLQLPAQVA